LTCVLNLVDVRQRMYF